MVVVPVDTVRMKSHMIRPAPPPPHLQELMLLYPLATRYLIPIKQPLGEITDHNYYIWNFGTPIAAIYRT